MHSYRRRVTGGFERLVQDPLILDAGDLHRDRQIQANMQRLNGRDAVVFGHDTAAERLHAEWRYALTIHHRENVVGETSEVRVHHVQRKLHSVKVEGVPERANGVRLNN